MITSHLRRAIAWLSAHALSVQSWSAVLLTSASTLVAYGVVGPGTASYRVLGGAVALLTVLAARSSTPPGVPTIDGVFTDPVIIRKREAQ